MLVLSFKLLLKKLTHPWPFFSLNIMLGHLNASVSSQTVRMKPEGGLFQQPPDLCLCFLPLRSGSTLPQPHTAPERCVYSAHPSSLPLCMHQPQPNPSYWRESRSMARLSNGPKVPSASPVLCSRHHPPLRASPSPWLCPEYPHVPSPH